MSACSDNSKAPNMQSLTTVLRNLAQKATSQITVNSLLCITKLHTCSWFVNTKALAAIHEAINESTNSDNIALSLLNNEPIYFLPAYSNSSTHKHSSLCDMYIKLVYMICEIEQESGIFHMNDQQFSDFVLSNTSSALYKLVSSLRGLLDSICAMALDIEFCSKYKLYIHTFCLLSKTATKVNYMCCKILDYLGTFSRDSESISTLIKEYEPFNREFCKEMNKMRQKIGLPFTNILAFNPKK